MSIIFEEVEDSICERAAYPGATKFVWATIDPATKNQLNLPIDYKYHSVFMPRKYVNWAEKYQNLKIRKDDVWIMGFNKSGTTWLHNIIRKLKNGLDFHVPPGRSGNEFIDFLVLFEENTGNEQFEKMLRDRTDHFLRYDEKPSPRTFKSHSPAFLAPKQIWTVKPKLIYIARNPKDLIVSYYHMARNGNLQFTGTLEDYCDLFMRDQLAFTPFIEHILSYWQLRHLDHVLFLTYEELSTDLFTGIKRISEFLDCSYTDKQLEELSDFVSFEKMRKNFVDTVVNDGYGKGEDSNYRHCRKGKVGGYRDDMSDELIKRLDEWTAQKLKHSGFKFLE